MKVVIKETKQVRELKEPFIQTGGTPEQEFYITKDLSLGNIPVLVLKSECTPLIDKITSLDEYQKLAARTLPDLTEFYPDVEGQNNANHIHMWFGVDSEIGEIIDLYKRSFAYRKKFDTVNLLEEVCDIMWYLAGEATLLKEPLSEYLSDITYLGNLVPDGEYPTIANMDDVLDACRTYNEGAITNEEFIGSFISSEEELFRGLTNNINKLIIRYPESFSTESALNRNLILERTQLEN